MAMLWLGRGKLALIYLIASFGVGVAIMFLESYGILDGTDYLLFLSKADLWSTLAFNVFGFIHAFNIRSMSLHRPWYRWIATVTVAVNLILLLLLLPMRVFLFHPFSIPSTSSHPSLVLGDYVFVSKFAYGYSRYSFPLNLAQFDGRIWGASPQRGDLAIFRLPSNTNIDYVKRVVGMPGDRIQMIGGVLNINGVPVKLEPTTLAPEFYDEPGIKFFRETLSSGRSYVIANILDESSADNTSEYIVPAGHYFVLGDNRDNSEDSRFLDAVGYIPEQNFIGPVVFHVWISRGFSMANRPEEIYP